MDHCPPRCLVSACLLGLCTRYDGQSKGSADCLRQLAPYHWSPVCPEQLGGLPTPRSPCRLVGGDGYGVLDGTARVVDQDGIDHSAEFVRGAEMVLTIARMQQVSCCMLKSGSPSCGLAPLTGVTAALLLRYGIPVIAG